MGVLSGYSLREVFLGYSLSKVFLGSLLKLSCVIDIFATFENPQIIFVKPALAVRIEFYEKIETNVGKPHWSGAVIALFTKKLWECELLGKL